jgi:hypothetical protein
MSHAAMSGRMTERKRKWPSFFVHVLRPGHSDHRALASSYKPTHLTRYTHQKHLGATNSSTRRFLIATGLWLILW